MKDKYNEEYQTYPMSEEYKEKLASQGYPSVGPPSQEHLYPSVEPRNNGELPAESPVAKQRDSSTHNRESIFKKELTSKESVKPSLKEEVLR